MGLLEWKALSQEDQEVCSLLSWAPQCQNTEFFSLEHSIALRRSCLLAWREYVSLPGICVSICACEAWWPGDSDGEATCSICTSSEIFHVSLTFHFYQVGFWTPSLSVCLQGRVRSFLSVMPAFSLLVGTAPWPVVVAVFPSMGKPSCRTLLKSSVSVCPHSFSFLLRVYPFWKLMKYCFMHWGLERRSICGVISTILTQKRAGTEAMAEKRGKWSGNGQAFQIMASLDYTLKFHFMFFEKHKWRS